MCIRKEMVRVQRYDYAFSELSVKKSCGYLMSLYKRRVVASKRG